jgi:integrase/recombinase XerC
MDLLEELLAGRRENTRRAYRGDLEAFRAFVAAPSVQAAIDALMQGGYHHSQAQFARYQEHLLRTGKSRATTARALAAVRSTLVLAHRKKLIAWEPPVRPPFPPAYKDTASGDGERLEKTLRELSESRIPIAVRDYAMVLLIGRMALRRSEVAALTMADLSLQRGDLVVRRNDGGAPDVVPTTPEAREALQRWVGVRGGWAGPLFVAARNEAVQRSPLSKRTVGRILSGYGLDSPRVLRPLAITSYLERTGGDLAGAQAFGRVRRASTVRTYERNRRIVNPDPMEMP